jgi:hypothetical protein
MATITFDREQYVQGEEAKITYVDAPSDGLMQIVNPMGGRVYSKDVSGSGTDTWAIPTDAPLGQYTVKLWSRSFGVTPKSDTMRVVSGEAPPTDKGTLKVNTSPTGASVKVGAVSCGTTPVTACALSPGWKEIILTKSGYETRVLMEEIKAGQTINLGTITLTPTAAPPAEGETRELDLGDYEVTWTLSGQDTLKAEITVTDTGVTCLSVTGGACNSATPPGVTISTFTVTGHLKSAVAPPTKGYLTVNTSPTGASVTVDIVFPCGATPVTKCELDTGTKTVKITKSGYNTETRSVTITAGATTNLGTITLTPTGVPPTGFDDWVTSKGGKNAITGGDINELTDAYIGLEDVGFSVTGADVNKVTDYYLGLG